MNTKMVWLVLVSAHISLLTSGQDTLPDISGIRIEKHTSINGFIRGGAYYDLNRKSSDSYVSSGFSDLGLKVESANSSKYKAYADVRFRYGSEFQKQVNAISIREAFVSFGGEKWDFSAGQKIVKWGRADFTNTASKFNPQNLISRSPDREDMDMGNILCSLNWFPSKIFDIQAVIVPFYRSSVLIIDPVPLPENTTIEQISGLITDQQLLSYGLRTDIHLRGIDWGISMFDGYDPMPGMSLKRFNLDITGTIPVASTQLSLRPYKTKVIGLDFESSIGSFGIRGEGAWSIPSLSYKTNEYVPLQEIRWVAGTDWSQGNWTITCEYSGKYIPDFMSPGADPLIGTKPDYSMLSQMLSMPGFDITDYVRRQVGAFNRLYNYQLKQFYHTAGIRVEADLLYGRILPSLFTIYNFSSEDLLIIPEIRYKPTDGLAIVAGAEFYKGRKGSLYDIVHDFMNSVYVAIRIDF